MENQKNYSETKITTPILSAQLLKRIHALNKDYLDLLAHQPFHTHSSPPFTAVHQVLARLSIDDLQTIAQTPFTLYSFSFHDRDFWTMALKKCDGAQIDARYIDAQMASAEEDRLSRWHRALCETALFLAWHTCALNSLTARLLYGMPEPVMTLVRSCEFWQLRQIARTYSQMLLPRWPSNPYFWPHLIKHAVQREPIELEEIKQMGSLLIASDLQAAQAHRTPKVGENQSPYNQRLPAPDAY